MCKLDLVPTDTISPDKAYRNISDINLGVLGAYALLDGGTIGVVSTVSDEATSQQKIRLEIAMLSDGYTMQEVAL